MAATQFGLKELTLLQHFFFALLLVLFSFSFLPCNANTKLYNAVQLDALQAVWNDWKQSTPDLSSNLAGWNSSQVYPCQQTYVGNSPNWRGVQCLNNIYCETDSTTDEESCNAFIIGLVLNNASIVGSLPPDIGNISTLTTLELTGNPKLGGPLPVTLPGTQLITLDLHDNAFYGEIPDFGSFEWPDTLDLSGNRFNGTFPLSQIQTMISLQTLSLGRNDFEGEIPENAFESFTQLVSLDLSSNRFTGSLPTLVTIKNLQVLDMSNNSFSGTLPDWSMLSSLRTVYLDSNLITGTLDIGRLYTQGLLRTRDLNTLGLLGVVSVMNNNISEVLYAGINIEEVTTVFRVQGNPFCNSPDSSDGTRCFREQICFNSAPLRNSDKRKVVIIVVVTVVSSLLVLLISLGVVFHRNGRYKRYLQLQVQQKFEEFEVKPTIFPYN